MTEANSRAIAEAIVKAAIKIRNGTVRRRLCPDCGNFAHGKEPCVLPPVIRENRLVKP